MGKTGDLKIQKENTNQDVAGAQFQSQTAKKYDQTRQITSLETRMEWGT